MGSTDAGVEFFLEEKVDNVTRGDCFGLHGGDKTENKGNKQTGVLIVAKRTVQKS
jgi:hypothetical protein